MVAGAAKAGLLTDFHTAIKKAIESGTTLHEFRKDFVNIVAKHGWSYNGGRNWRTRVIYETNLTQAYNAGREAQFADPDLQALRPYAQYKHGGSLDPREEHLAWDGLVLPINDSWWNTHSPMNGWGCTCYKIALSERDLQRKGLKVSKAPKIEWEDKVVGSRGANPLSVRVPKGIDAGFEHRSVQIGVVKAATPTKNNTPLPILKDTKKATDNLPPPRANTTKPIGISNEASEAEIIQKFLDEFGAKGKEAIIYKDVIGTRIPLSDNLFKTRKGKWKLFKNNRHLNLHYLIDTIKSPDEIWIVQDPMGKKTVFRRRYIRRFPEAGGLAVFEFSLKEWREVTLFNPSDDYVKRLGYESIDDYLEDQRRGIRIYKSGQ